MKWNILALHLVLVFAPAAHSLVQKVDLKAALLLAVEKSPQFDNLKKDLEISELELKAAEARQLPSLDLNANHGIVDTSPRSSANAPWSSSISLDLTESLYDNGVIRLKIQIARLNLEKAELKLKEQKNKLAFELASRFVDYSLQEELAVILAKQIGLVEKQYQATAKDYFQGLKTKKDFLRLKTQLLRSNISAANGRASVERAKLELMKLIEGDRLQSSFVVSEIVFEKQDLIQVGNFSSGMIPKTEDHLQFKIARLENEVSDLNTEFSRKRVGPEIFLSTGASYNSSDYVVGGRFSGTAASDNAKWSWNALINLKYNVFDWGARSSEAAAMRLRARVQQNERAKDLNDLAGNLERIALNRKQALQNLEVAQQLFDLEKSNLEYIEQEFRNGKVSYLDLITALNDQADAESKLFTALSELQSAQFAVLMHQGGLYDKILK